MPPQSAISVFTNKHILLGVTGGVAAYKVVDLASKLTQAGAFVDVIMTESAQRFVTPLSFQAVTGRKVYTDLWSMDIDVGLRTHIQHVGLAQTADVLLIAPATANTIAKLALGLADNLLTTVALTVTCPMMVAPAMEGHMYAHPTTQNHLATLQQRGVTIIKPTEGRLASGQTGVGRLPETAELLGQLRRCLGADGPLKGKKVVVTAGGTREFIDPVRVITNRSSGKQGFAIAQAALDQGATVSLIAANSTLPVPIGCTYIPVETAAEMKQAVTREITKTDILVMVAAAADFKPAESAHHKIKKDQQKTLTIDLTPTEDILKTVKGIRHKTQSPRVVVGFAAESQNLIENARKKLTEKELDMVVANDISKADAGFEVDTNRVVIVDKQGNQEAYQLMTKKQVAETVMAKAAELV